MRQLFIRTFAWFVCFMSCCCTHFAPKVRYAVQYAFYRLNKRLSYRRETALQGAFQVLQILRKLTAPLKCRPQRSGERARRATGYTPILRNTFTYWLTNSLATQQMMVVPRHRLSTVGRRALAVQGPMVWNSLPDDIAHSRTMCSLNSAWKPGFSLASIVLSALETACIIALYKFTFTFTMKKTDSMGWVVKAGMVRVWVAGKTVWSHCYTRVISERFRDKELIYKALYKFTFFTLLFTIYHYGAIWWCLWWSVIGWRL